MNYLKTLKVTSTLLSLSLVGGIHVASADAVTLGLLGCLQVMAKAEHGNDLNPNVNNFGTLISAGNLKDVHGNTLPIAIVTGSNDDREGFFVVTQNEVSFYSVSSLHDETRYVTVKMEGVKPFTIAGTSSNGYSIASPKAHVLSIFARKPSATFATNNLDSSFINNWESQTQKGEELLTSLESDSNPAAYKKKQALWDPVSSACDSLLVTAMASDAAKHVAQAPPGNTNGRNFAGQSKMNGDDIGSNSGPGTKGDAGTTLVPVQQKN